MLIRNGMIIDGSGSERFKGDIGISEGKTVEVGDLADEQGDVEIDATGRFVAPGFIDNHTHSDWTILVHPTGDSKVMQGVTTELGGLCGYAAAPIDRDQWWKLLYVRMTVGWSARARPASRASPSTCLTRGAWSPHGPRCNFSRSGQLTTRNTSG
jgi:N-acyl-D-aspartate/D-glutamate deacylase